MNKKKILHMEEFSTGQRLRTLKKGAKVRRVHPRKALLNKRFTTAAIWECIENNDLKGAFEILKIHMRARADEESDATVR